MNKPKITTFHTDPSVKYNVSGVYMITFSSKHFYIGCSKNVTNRIKTHTVDILYGERGVKGIMAMSGFKGKVTFTLLEEVNAETHGENWAKKLFEVEKKHQNKRWRSKYCLNHHTTRTKKIAETPKPTLIPCFDIAEFLMIKGTTKNKRCLPCRVIRNSFYRYTKY